MFISHSLIPLVQENAPVAHDSYAVTAFADIVDPSIRAAASAAVHCGPIDRAGPVIAFLIIIFDLLSAASG
jgi:hypothetical protein